MQSVTKSYYIPKRSHFNLIGRGGSNIRGLQEDFSVKINIPRKEENTSKVTITGDASDVNACKEEIQIQLGYNVIIKKITFSINQKKILLL